MTTPITVTTLPATSSASPQSYVMTPPVQDPKGMHKWIIHNLRLIKIALDQLTVMTPQSATQPPTNPQDGMQRLARAPWCPISAGQTNVWVYYDITANSGAGGWVAL